MGSISKQRQPPLFHYQQFAQVATLVEQKRQQGLCISLCIPTLNEAKTIGQVVTRLIDLRDKIGLVDEIAVIDSGSTDQTQTLATAAGADVYLASAILPELGPQVGKGENLWKALYQLQGDLFVFVDGDLSNLHPGFVTGLLGPLLGDQRIGYVKGFYTRPQGIAAQQETQSCEQGGRLTEILVRPLLALHYPHLSTFIQPLGGEYAARRSLLEQLTFPVGYGVELAHLLDLSTHHGLSLFAQTDLGSRCHRLRSNGQLGQAAYGILQVLYRRLKQEGTLEWQPEQLAPLVQYAYQNGSHVKHELFLPENERPPMIELSQYRQRRGEQATPQRQLVEN
ncbi:glucosyl-3-phosphoglycerate synthase [Desulfobulbus rhabdoformis]|uniref:glucosyl-3-phosphoglycerate synthase n=1 Tax=Desulfobulbus rhabdoformis TaxID=34032 RepID=UPI001964E571|nr:glucosyl-3-phosphoglycerate synthase [Desulfobulbus rhabdoformis]MBM9615843.1 glucosyl-3-phosphoglycerate synthase [Desulfobulbus rhabdoformis]